MGCCRQIREPTPEIILASFQVIASAVLLDELRSGSKPMSAIRYTLSQLYSSLVFATHFGRVYHAIQPQDRYGELLVRKVLESAEEAEWIRKSGGKYELDKRGIELVSEMDSYHKK